MKFFLIISSFLLLSLTLVLVGCSNNSQQVSGDKQNTNIASQDQRGAENGNQPPSNIWEENFEELSLADLALNQKITVMGAENADGSVLAERIIAGNNGVDFPNMFGRTRPAGDESAGNSGDANFPLPPDPSSERPDFTRFQNMSDGEREQFRQEMRERIEKGDFSDPAAGGRFGGGNGDTARVGGRQGMARLIGEIVKKDETSLTLKLEDGGSKLVFITNETKVLKPKAAAETGGI